MAAANIPHPAKVSYGGEDAYFISDSGAGAAGVADGVGGWAESGINPKEYSETFMDVAKRYLEGESLANEIPVSTTTTTSSESVMGKVGISSGEWMDIPQQEDPVSAAAAAAAGSSEDDDSSFTTSDATTARLRVEEEEEKERSALGALAVAHRLTRKPGTATACVLRLDPATNELDAANLGDSGFLIIRDSKVIFQSPHLQHFFDCPFQFGAAPEFTEATDTADDADVFRIGVQAGDVIVLATDGVLDNVWPRDILHLAPKSGVDVQGAATAMATLAAAQGADPSYMSPYAVEAAQEGLDIPIWEKLTSMSFTEGKLQLGKLQGGKMDDVTVVVAFVEPKK